MPSKEHEALVEQVGQLVYKAQCHRSNPNHAASEILSTIRAALQEPTEGMIAAVLKHYGTDFDNEFAVDNIVDDWSKMLAASALGEQSDG